MLTDVVRRRSVLFAGVQVPADPSNLVASTVGTTEIDLSWTDNSSNEDGFEVWRSTDSGVTFSLLALTAAGATSYNNTGLTAGHTRYDYKVRARTGGGSAYSGYTSTVTAYTWTAAAVPAEVGTATRLTTGTTTAIAVTATHANAIGSRIVVTVALDGGVTGSVTVADSRGNTYTLLFDKDAGVLSGRVLCFTAMLLTSLVNGDSVTITHPSTQQVSALAFRVTHISESSAEDKTATTSGTGTALSSGTTAATAQADEFLVAAWAVYDVPTGSTMTAGSGWTQRTAVDADSGVDSLKLFTEHKTVAATGTQAADGTLADAGNWAGGIGTLKSGA